MYLINEEQNNLESAKQLLGFIFEVENALTGSSPSAVEVTEKDLGPGPGLFGEIAYRQTEISRTLQHAHRIIQRLRETLHIVELNTKLGTPGLTKGGY